LHSLAQANSLLTEKKSSLKSLRKAHKTALSEIRKEMEKHRGLIGNDRGEERAFRRNLALRESIKRAEEETEQMAAGLADLQHLPDKMKPEWESKKKQWQAEKRRLSAALAKAAEEKANADRQATAVESEVVALAAKKEKLMARLSKLRIDLGKLDSANSEDSDTKEKKQAEREAIELHRKALEKEYKDAIERLEARINEYSRSSHENWSTYYTLEQAAADMPLPGSAHGSGSNLVLPFGMIPHDPQNLQMSSGRERSMSLFSDGSVITNLSELGHASNAPAFEAFGNRHNPLEYASVGVIGGGKGGQVD
jgi:chromosome segregation ATPase